jgi:hypothetical protein
MNNQKLASSQGSQLECLMNPEKNSKKWVTAALP